MHTRAPLLIGRERELDRLEQILVRARAAHGGSVFLMGEPGIGKSRLAAEAASSALAAGMRVLRGRASSVGPAMPFRPLTEALLSLFRSGDVPDERQFGPYRPVLGRLIPDWNHGDTSTDGSLVVLAEAVLRLTSVLGRQHGCLVLLEDLHETDAETLAVLEYLVDNLAGAPTVLLITTRGEPCGAVDLARSADLRRTGLLLELSALDVPAVRELIASCLEIEPAEVPPSALDTLWANSAGNPFMVEELLYGMISSGQLAKGRAGWRVVGEGRPDVPVTLIRSVAGRIDRLGPQARALLSGAAVLGKRFPLSVVQRITGLDDRSLLSQLRAGVAAQLVAADEPAPDWYAFQHPLTGEALLAMLTPADRARLSAQAADAVEAIHPGLPGEWCQLVASLRAYTGDALGAARLFAEAGRRALADGAAASAITLLERGAELLARHPDVGARAEVLEALVHANAEADRFEAALELVDTLDALGDLGLSAPRRAALHVRLAWIGDTTGHWAQGIAQVEAARSLLGDDPADEDAAPLDAVAANLALEAPGRDRKVEAERLALRAIAAAERVPLPAIACQAMLVLGTVARERDIAESTACFDRVRLLAERHRLVTWQIYALVRLAGNDWLAANTTSGLERARQEARRAGAVTIGYVIDSSFAIHHVLCGHYAEAAALIESCWADASRLRLPTVLRHLLMSRATLAAHQGRRGEMEQALEEFRTSGEELSQEYALALGLAATFCALIEEDEPRARVELARVAEVEDANPSTFSLAGRHGIGLLLDVSRGAAGWPEYEQVSAAPIGGMRWNRQFVLLAHAVLLGRSGQGAQAQDAVGSALRVAEPYPLTRHLGLRLVAEAAYRDGWGAPELWLRTAEEYFHGASLPAIASACRALLRQLGASVPQRRTGTERVPAALRSLGVTVREYEVFELLVDRMGNRMIAAKLHISHRTVEKHVANLLVKTGQPDREALNDFARRFAEARQAAT